MNFYLQIAKHNFVINYIDNKITAVKFTDKLEKYYENIPQEVIDIKQQLEAYFNKQLYQFDLTNIEIKASNFQKHIIEILADIKYGETICYQQLAVLAGNKKAVRAVASAVARNPFHIIIPCHRVIRKNGDLGKYAGGSALKKSLIELERIIKNS